MLSPLYGQLGPLTRFGTAIQYLLHDEFPVAQAAPLGSTRTASPGPGTWSIVDTGGYLSVTGGRLRIANVATSQADPMFLGSGFSRVMGRAFLGKVKTGSTIPQADTGWMSSNAGGTGMIEHCIRTFGANDVRYVHGNSLQVNADTVANVEFEFCNMLRSSGCYLFMRLPGETLWRLIFVENLWTTPTLYPGHIRAGITSPIQQEISSLRILDWPTNFPNDSRFTSDYGLAASRIVGSVASGTTFTHNKDAFIEISLPTFPASAGEVSLYFRYQNALNYWRISYPYPSRVRSIIECVNGVETVRATSAVGGGLGARLTLHLDGTRIYCHMSSGAGSQAFYLTASTGLTATAGMATFSGGFSGSNLGVYDTYHSLQSV